MSSGAFEPIFSRRTFIAFLFLAPVGIFCVFAIIVVLQYRQFQAMLSPLAETQEYVWGPPQIALRDSLIVSLTRFSALSSGDSLRLGSEDLTLLLNASPIAREQHLSLSVQIMGDSLFVLRTTQAIDDLQGRLAWIFKKLGRSGFLNARVEGRPKLENDRLDLDPDRGFLNNQKIPRSALVKRGGFSPGDFIHPRDGYETFVRSLAKVKLDQGGVLLLRK